MDPVYFKQAVMAFLNQYISALLRPGINATVSLSIRDGRLVSGKVEMTEQLPKD